MKTFKSIIKLIREGSDSFVNNDDGYWNLSQLKSIGLLKTLESLSEVYHDLKSKEAEQSTYTTTDQLVEFLKITSDDLNKSIQAMERMI